MRQILVGSLIQRKNLVLMVTGQYTTSFTY